MDTYNTLKNLMERMDRVELLMQDTIQQLTDLADRLEPSPVPTEIIDPRQLSHVEDDERLSLGGPHDEGVEGVFDRDSDDE